MKGKLKKRASAHKADEDAADSSAAVAEAAQGSRSKKGTAGDDLGKIAAEDGKAKKGKTEAESIDGLKDRLLRLQADFENFKKRMFREKTELYRRANEDMMLEMLPVLDHMDLGLSAAVAHDDKESFTEGMRLVLEQMLSALSKFGLSPVDAEGLPFDPHLHEAISHLVSDEVSENTVMTQTRRGYMLGDRLLRAAQVVVSSGSQMNEKKLLG